MKAEEIESGNVRYNNPKNQPLDRRRKTQTRGERRKGKKIGRDSFFFFSGRKGFLWD